jgi:hypothetical protein
MQPQDLRTESFSHYPPQAAAIAATHVALFQKMPLSLLPMILLQLIDYDWRFPAEQRNLRRQLDYLGGLSSAELAEVLKPFARTRLSPEWAHADWVNQPEHYSELFGALLWSSMQVEEYRKAVFDYDEAISRILDERPPDPPRFAIVVVGQGVEASTIELFRPLRPHGVLFTGVQPKGGLRALLDFVNARAKQHPETYAHWYIDGGQADSKCGLEQGVTATCFARLVSADVREMNLTNQFIQQLGKSGPVGPEAVRSYIANLRPDDLGLVGKSTDAVLRHFETNLLTEGAGTQVFSTTFVQWAARESLRRSQPSTLLARFAPRQQMAPMNELLNRDPLKQPTDPEGSLVDADMGAYYTWINQRRLSGADQSRFLAWFEGHNVALAIAPSLPRGQVSAQRASIPQILDWMS